MHGLYKGNRKIRIIVYGKRKYPNGNMILRKRLDYNGDDDDYNYDTDDRGKFMEIHVVMRSSKMVKGWCCVNNTINNNRDKIKIKISGV